MEYKVTRIMALILFLIMMTATIPLGYAYDGSPDMRLTWDSSTDSMPSIAQANDGKIWVVWRSYRTGNADIFYKVYDPSQVHPWSSERSLITHSATDTSPSIMQAEDGKIWVVWSTNRNGNYDIYYKTSSDNGATWSTETPLPVAVPAADDQDPSIMQTASGTIWLSWSTNRNGNYDIYYKTSSDNGATWSTETSMYAPNPPPAADDQNPSITQTADGKIWVVWVRNYDIYYKTYNGTHWSGGDNTLTQDSATKWDLNPSIAQISNGDIWVVWDSGGEDEQKDIYYRYRYWIGDNIWFWSFKLRLTYDQADDLMPSIMQTTDGTIWIVWTSWRSGNCDIYYRKIQLNVNGFTEVSGWTGWTRAGSSPWLGSEDYPYNYIWSNVAGDNIGYFTFQDLPTGIVWNTVKLCLKTWQTGGDGSDYINIYLYDGSNWTPTPYTVIPTSTAAPGDYKEVDVSSWLNTEAKINAAQLRLEKIQVGTEDTIGVDHAFISLPSHDVAIFSVIPTEVTVNPGQQVPVSIEVVAQNHGTYSENVTVRVYADSTLMNETTIGLSPGRLYRETLTWNGLNAGTYKIWAKVSVIDDGEIYILDNTFPALLGDVNGDQTVNASDLSGLSNAYGSQPIDTNWNPNANFNGDAKVDAYDLFDLGKNYGISQ